MRLRTFGELSRGDGEPVEPPRELLSNARSNAELTAEAHTPHPTPCPQEKPFQQTLVKDINEDQQEYAQGQCQPATPQQLMAEILA